MKGITRTPESENTLNDMAAAVERMRAGDAPELAVCAAIFIVVNPDGSISHMGFAGRAAANLSLAGMMRIQTEVLETGVKSIMAAAVANKMIAQAEKAQAEAAGRKSN